MDDRRLSKTIAHALRHAPHLYELELDEGGWAEVETLLQALRQHREQWRGLGVEDLERMMASAAKQRYEMQGGRIRALYGHSLPGKLARVPAEPPEALYHGTAPATARVILEDGIRPMSRQYVHLSVDVETAMEVGRRKGAAPVLLRVQARRAHEEEGVAFYEGNELVWLADFVPGAYCEEIEP